MGEAPPVNRELISELTGAQAHPAPSLTGRDVRSTRAADDRVAVADELGDAAVVGQVLTDPDHELAPDGGGELLEGLQHRAGPPTLHTGDRRLGGAHPVCELGLG